jgi:capsular polysaccharide biosynthesis protein
VYGHWLGDVLPGILDLLDPLRAGRLRLVSPPLTAWQRRCLALLGVPHGAVDEVDARSILCADLVWHTYATTIHTHQPTPLIEATFRRLRASSEVGASVDGPRLLYVSRIGLPGRRCVNEPALAAELERLGFTVVSPERLTIDGQIALFSGAAAVVGLHGSGLANVGFAPRGCLLVDILSPRQPVAWLFRLTRQLGHRYVCQVGDDLPGAAAARDSSAATAEPYRFRVDVERVIRTIQAAMARLGLSGAR